MRVHGCNEMKLFRAGGPEQCIFVLCKLHRSLIHEEKEREKKKNQKKSNCAASGFLSLWLLSSRWWSEDDNAAPNYITSCLYLHVEIWVLNREQSVTFCQNLDPLAQCSVMGKRKSAQQLSANHCIGQGISKSMHKLTYPSQAAIKAPHLQCPSTKEQTLCRIKSQKQQQRFPNLFFVSKDAGHAEKTRPTIWDNSWVAKIYSLNHSTVDLH